MIRERIFYLCGILFLAMSKIKYLMKGYTSPKPYSIEEYEKCHAYSLRVVDNWLAHLDEYTNSNYSIENKNVLELGPGSDLGVGLYLLSKGIFKYNCMDVHDLEKYVPDSFYRTFLERLGKNSTNCKSSK
jgi:hypothetical protein